MYHLASMATREGKRHMIKTILVDDEDIIREGLSNFIDWPALGLELVGQASNGREAVELVKIMAPEVIVTDVKMPMMSGIELLALAKDQKPDCVVIMISSYDEFEYAQQSLNLGAFAYLLKPIDTDKLIQLLKEAVLKIQKARSGEKILNTYRDVLEQTQRKILDNKIKLMALGGKVDTLNEAETQYLGQFTKFCVASVNTESPRYHEESFMEEMGIHLEEWKNGHGVAADIKQFQNQDRMTVFCIMEKGDMTIQFRKLLTIYSRYYIKAVLGISDIVESVRELSAAYRQSLEAIEYRFFTDRSLICYSTVREEIQSSFKDMPDWNRNLEKSMKHGGECEIKTFTDDFLSYVYQAKPSPVIIRTAVSAILLETIRTLRTAGGKPEDLFLSVSDTITAVLNESNPALMARKLREILLSVSVYISRLEKLRPNSVVQKARKYIEENYWNPDLRLDDVAGYVYINASYFSSVFSKEMGISFGDYLTKVRIEKAMDLLKNTHMKIYEIADLVGYQNPSWFNVAFKRYTGQKPGDFRK